MNNELLKVIYDNDRQTVLGRDLYEFLEVNSNYTTWFKRMVEYGFVEETDFIPFSEESTGGRPQENYQITIDMAKELAMLQRTDKGKEARTYFIELEKAWNSPETVMARALMMSQKMIDDLKNQLEESKPLIIFAETCLKSKNNILVRELSKIAQEQGLDIGEKKLYKKLREWNLVLSSSTEPAQTGMNLGGFVVEETSIETAYSTKLVKTTKVTPKGQVYIIEKLKKL